MVCVGWSVSKHQHLLSVNHRTLFRRICGVTGAADGLPASNPHFAFHCQLMQPPDSAPSTQPVSLLRTPHPVLQPPHTQAATSLLHLKREQVFLRPPMASSLPAPEETSTNPCVFPTQAHSTVSPMAPPQQCRCNPRAGNPQSQPPGPKGRAHGHTAVHAALGSTMRSLGHTPLRNVSPATKLLRASLIPQCWHTQPHPENVRPSSLPLIPTDPTCPNPPLAV